MATPPLMPKVYTRDADERSFRSDDISVDEGIDYPDKLDINWKSFFISGGGFMVDQYNLFVIGTVILAMSVTPGVGAPSKAEGSAARAIKLVGAMVGQLSFGWIADRLGRRVACLLTLLLVLVGAIGSASAAPYGPIDIYMALCVWQLVLGIGVGGEYPLSASMSRESASDLRSVGLTFCMQGMGFLLSPLVVLLLLRAYPDDTPGDLARVWRYALGFSAIPAALLLLPRYTMHSSKAFENASKGERHNKPLSALLGRTSWRRLAGTAGTWFLFDISFYGNSILAAQAFAALNLVSQPQQTPHQKIESAAYQLAVVALMGLPGYVAAIMALPYLGLRQMQVLGFIAISGIFLALGTMYDTLSSTSFVLLYGLTFFFSNFGPNFTTFVLPAVLFDTSSRARCHGISAAAGKFGGALGVFLFSNMMADMPPADAIPYICIVCAFVSAAGLLLTVLCIDRNPEAVSRSFDRKELRAFAKLGLQSYGAV